MGHAPQNFHEQVQSFLDRPEVRKVFEEARRFADDTGVHARIANVLGEDDAERPARTRARAKPPVAKS